jgi:hypothetical protein
MFGLGGNDGAIVELDHVDVAANTPELGRECEGLREGLVWFIGGGILIVVAIDDCGTQSDTPTSTRGPSVLSSPFDSVGGLDEDALDVFQIEKAWTVDQLVAHPYRNEIGIGVRGRVNERFPHDTPRVRGSCDQKLIQDRFNFDFSETT